MGFPVVDFPKQGSFSMISESPQTLPYPLMITQLSSLGKDEVVSYSSNLVVAVAVVLVQ